MEVPTPQVEYFLYPGLIFVGRAPYMIRTILGSCISVCFWDPVLKLAGINHYMLPLWNADGLPSPKYGNIAIMKLIEKMLILGSQKVDLQAKVFGGGNVIRVTNGLLNVGERNITVAQDMLRKESIPVVSTDVGGYHGRKLIFDAGSGDVFIRKIRKRYLNSALSIS
jgi:chemotaxis protein CheD